MRRFMGFMLVVLVTISCKKDSEGSICFSRTATQLKIENPSKNVLYIASFGQNILPSIEWAPTCGNNNIQPGGSANLELSSITGYSANDKLVVYWWECGNGNAKQIHTVVLDDNQKVCQ